MPQTSIQPTSSEARAAEQCQEPSCTNNVIFWVHAVSHYEPGKPMETHQNVSYYPAPDALVCGVHVGWACEQSTSYAPGRYVVTSPPQFLERDV